MAQRPVGEKVDLTVLREGQDKTVTVALGELPADTQARAEQSEESTENWGLTVAELTPDVARRFQLEPEQKGVVVVDIEPGSPAEMQGLQRGDLIEEVDRTPAKSVEDFKKAVTKAQGKDTLLLLVRRGEATTFFALNKSA